MPARTIGAVVRELVEEFPDVTISKIRFLEAEGLLTPERAPSGYRRYGPDDVERLRYVLRAQRDHFWPLRVIKEALAAADRGLEPGGPDHPPWVPEAGPDPDLPDAAAVRAGQALRVTAAELGRASGLEPAAVAELVEHGLLAPGGDGGFDVQALRAARAAAGLAGFGLEARHLRAVRVAVDRELGLAEQVLGPRRGEDAERATEEVARLLLALHAALLRSALERPE
ncbi:MerR family transcriptional regulator [Phycicoccus endophyticus]|uniref:MerR family transcriptional regulator n=1 Tax=Phycicoccus endophyticus TaxID=1690220 RepID=A0A7G9R4M9_9MICO|nr:MerR family transcriptional regulator [Phycicoccus endophyticus]NHI18452.1 MerR family transcriptional regulator [Phycicoccus endophyticus]QNN50554.1 MerR family transcriptional regulator [Phycicoccus endophyticus]